MMLLWKLRMKIRHKNCRTYYNFHGVCDINRSREILIGGTLNFHHYRNSYNLYVCSRNQKVRISYEEM